MSQFGELKDLIEEYGETVERINNACDAWEHGSPEDQAENDPGIQFEIECHLESIQNNILDKCAEILRTHGRIV